MAAGTVHKISGIGPDPHLLDGWSYGRTGRGTILSYHCNKKASYESLGVVPWRLFFYEEVGLDTMSDWATTSNNRRRDLGYGCLWHLQAFG